MNKNTFPLVAIFLMLSGLNIVVFYGYHPVSSFIIGELIIVFVIIDLKQSPYHFHVYQLILLYFYYSLAITHSFNNQILNQKYYAYAYTINLLHFLFFMLGYHSRPYVFRLTNHIPRQNYIYLIYVLFGLVMTFMGVYDIGVGETYSGRIPSFEETRNMPIYQMGISNIYGNFMSILIFLMNHPLFYGIHQFLSSIFGYFGSGVKAGVLTSATVLIMIYQFYFKRLSLSMIFWMFPLSFFSIMILIGTTTFRGQLGIESFISVLNYNDIIRSLTLFLSGSESNHIVNTAKILEMIEQGKTTFRYGFDYYRFFLYPVKHFFTDFEFASYNQFVHILVGKKVNQGLYVGLGGELFWNFGYIFFVFSFLHGLAFKIYTNWGFSGRWPPTVTYLLLYHLILWHLYRGQGNNLVMSITFYIIGITGFLIFWKIFKNQKLVFIRKYLIRIRYRGREIFRQH